MKIKILSVTIVSYLFFVSSVNAQNFNVLKTEIFKPQNKKVLLLEDSESHKKIILFQTTLRVNTDGTPLSYHPYDPLGKVKALNNICNAIVVKKAGGPEKNLCFTNFKEAIGVFEKFRDANYLVVPEGYEITWSNVLASIKTKEEEKYTPCVFGSGDFKGYLGSLTALHNGLKNNKGECDINDQINPLTLPALVLVGGKSVVRKFGGNVGDLLVAYNPKNQLYSSAIIGDTGPKDNLGEGSIYLNMQLLGVKIPPKNKSETFKLSIENTQVLIAIIPASHLFEVIKPYSKENINQRVKNWQKEAGFSTPDRFIEFMKTLQSNLN